MADVVHVLKQEDVNVTMDLMVSIVVDVVQIAIAFQIAYVYK